MASGSPIHAPTFMPLVSPCYYLLTKDYPDSGLYHGPLEPVIRKCIALDRSERYPDAAALRAELLKYTDPNMVQTTTENTKSVDNDSDSSGNIFTKHFYSYREKLPVGFRSGVIWKMCTAVWGYLFIFWLCRSMTTTASDGSSMTGYPLFVNRRRISDADRNCLLPRQLLSCPRSASIHAAKPRAALDLNRGISFHLLYPHVLACLFSRRRIAAPIFRSRADAFYNLPL